MDTNGSWEKTNSSICRTTKFTQVISWLSPEWTDWIKSFSGELVLEVVTLWLFLKSKVKCTLSKVRMLGTGRRKTSRETSGVNGSSMLKTLASTLPCFPSERKSVINSTTLLLLNGSTLLRTSPMDTTISSSVGLTLNLRISLKSLMSTLFTAFSLWSKSSSPLFQRALLVKLSINDSTPLILTSSRLTKSCSNVTLPLLKYLLCLNKTRGCTLMVLLWFAPLLLLLSGRLVVFMMEFPISR